MYKKCIPYLSGEFSKLCSNRKKSLWFQSKPLSLYPWLTLIAIFLNLVPKKGDNIVLPPLNFPKWGGQFPPALSAIRWY